MKYSAQRQTLVTLGRRLWERGMVAANDGNLSLRLDDGSVLATPTGVSKGFMTPEAMVHLAADGTPLSAGKASSEIKMHLAVYEERPDIHAVVHAHPIFATSFAVAEIPLNQALLPEAVLFLGAVPLAPYGAPSTAEIPRDVRPLIRKGDAVLLAHHGALTVGADLETAYYRMETLEHAAQINYRARQLGPLKPLPTHRIHELVALRGKYGMTGKVDLTGFDLSSE